MVHALTENAQKEEVTMLYISLFVKLKHSRDETNPERRLERKERARQGLKTTDQRAQGAETAQNNCFRHKAEQDQGR